MHVTLVSQGREDSFKGQQRDVSARCSAQIHNMGVGIDFPEERAAFVAEQQVYPGLNNAKDPGPSERQFDNLCIRAQSLHASAL